MSKHLEDLLKEYRKQYYEWLLFMYVYYDKDFETPDDDLLLCFAVREALEVRLQVNKNNRKLLAMKER